MPLIKLFLDICLFRKGPQNVPSSPALLAIVALAYLIVGLLLLGAETDLLDATAQVFAEAAVMPLFIGSALKLAGLMPRFLQTLIAVLGTDALVSAIAVPLMFWAPKPPEGEFAYLGLLLLTLWHLTVVANIFRHALSRSLGLGLGLAIVYLVARYQVIMYLFAPGS